METTFNPDYIQIRFNFVPLTHSQVDVTKFNKPYPRLGSKPQKIIMKLSDVAYSYARVGGIIFSILQDAQI